MKRKLISQKTNLRRLSVILGVLFAMIAVTLPAEARNDRGNHRERGSRQQQQHTFSRRSQFPGGQNQQERHQPRQRFPQPRTQAPQQTRPRTQDRDRMTPRGDQSRQQFGRRDQDRRRTTPRQDNERPRSRHNSESKNERKFDRRDDNQRRWERGQNRHRQYRHFGNKRIHEIVSRKYRRHLHEHYRRSYWDRRSYHERYHMRHWFHRRVQGWTPYHWYRGHCLPQDIVSVGFSVDTNGFGITVSGSSAPVCWHYKHNPYYFHDTRWYYVDPFADYYEAYYIDDPYRYTYTPAYEGSRYWYYPTARRLAMRMFALVGGPTAGTTGYIAHPALRLSVNKLRQAMLVQSATRAATFQLYLDAVAAYADYRANNMAEDELADEFEGMLRAMSYQYDYALRLYDDN